ncbi:MAG TPA: hypothetical protein VLM11_11400 [Streptosporangiaceae bacterium]|nr:hypothetical protein [Streptosporangiaceae bacterium]
MSSARSSARGDIAPCGQHRYGPGRHNYADSSRSRVTSMLGEILVPDVDEINQDPEFSATRITATEVWQRATWA